MTGSAKADIAVRPDWGGIVGCALAAAIGIAAIATSGDFSPLGSVFPRTIAGLMVVFALSYIVLALRRPKSVDEPAAGSRPRRFGTAVVMLAWAFLLQPVGFLFTSICASIALLLLAQYERWTARTAIVYAFAIALILGGLYALFRFALQVPLPVGLFW